MDDALSGRLQQDLTAAMKAGDQTSRDAIRFLRSALKNAEIEAGGPLSPEASTAVLRRQAKQLNDAIDQYRAGNRPDLAEREQAQLAVLERYLPRSLTDEELHALVAEVVEESGARGIRDLSKVMPRLMDLAGGRADGRRLSEAARSALTAAERSSTDTSPR